MLSKLLIFIGKISGNVLTNGPEYFAQTFFFYSNNFLISNHLIFLCFYQSIKGRERIDRVYYFSGFDWTHFSSFAAQGSAAVHH